MLLLVPPVQIFTAKTMPFYVRGVQRPSFHPYSNYKEGVSQLGTKLPRACFRKRLQFQTFQVKLSIPIYSWSSLPISSSYHILRSVTNALHWVAREPSFWGVGWAGGISKKKEGKTKREKNVTCFPLHVSRQLENPQNDKSPLDRARHAITITRSKVKKKKNLIFI